MLKKYIINKEPQSTGEHEIHTEYCSYLPNIENQEYLGYFDNCSDAIKEAKKEYDNVDGCYWCSKSCHTR